MPSSGIANSCTALGRGTSPVPSATSLARATTEPVSSAHPTPSPTPSAPVISNVRIGHSWWTSASYR